MDKNEIIEIDDWVEIIKEGKTQGLIGGHFRVLSTSQSGVEVMVNGKGEPFNYDEIRKMSFKEKWGFDKLPTMYHGTDMRFALLPEDIRKTYLHLCQSILNESWSIFKPYIIPGEDRKELLSEDIRNQFPELNSKVKDALNNLMMMGWSEDFQYGDFYLTSLKHQAAMYAINAYAGGELGYTTYYLAKGLQMAGNINLFENDKYRDMFKLMTKMVEEEHKPAIFKFDKLSPLFLRTEKNESILRYLKDGSLTVFSFRYLKPLKLEVSQSELISKDLKKFWETA